VKRRGGRLFLDLKLHDIPETVGRAAASAARFEAEFLTVHAAGGEEMMKRAVEGAGSTRVLAVTVLTSLNESDLSADGLAGPVAAAVARRAKVAAAAGVAGLVCSPQEIAEAKAVETPEGLSLLAVVPGVRPAGSSLGDQKRVATPASTIAAGADYLVIGRPIRDAPEPAAAFAAVVRELEGALPGV
jgi:orotidine-5'-phosphate decarboxylase